MDYEHTQKAPYRYLLYVLLAVLAFVGWQAAEAGDSEAVLPVLLLAVLFTVVFSGFETLTVSDGGDHLLVQYGPLPLFRKRIPYHTIARVEPDRTSLIDGWGIHWIPWRGTTYNLWGFDCVKLEVGRRTIRIGTDEPENLVAFLNSRIGVGV